MKGLGTAVATLITFFLAAGEMVAFQDGAEAIVTGALAVILGFIFNRTGVIQRGDINEDGVVDDRDTEV